MSAVGASGLYLSTISDIVGGTLVMDEPDVGGVGVFNLPVKLIDKLSGKNNLILLIIVKLIYEKY